MSAEPYSIYFFGNGASRRGLDPARFRLLGLTVGFNAGYREHEFDLIASGDPKISEEIRDNWPRGWIRRDHKRNRDSVYFTTGPGHKPCEDLRESEKVCELFKPETGAGWLTGSAAVYAACKMFKPTEIWLFGFDMDKTHLYRDEHPNHRDKDNSSIWNRIFKDHPQVRFVRVGPQDRSTPFLDCEHMTYEVFHASQRCSA